jgi:hypothetical protein
LASSPDGKLFFGAVGARTHFILEEMQGPLFEIPAEIINELQKSKMPISSLLTLITNGLSGY